MTVTKSPDRSEADSPIAELRSDPAFTPLLGLEDFLGWCQVTLNLETSLTANNSLRLDLGLDDVALFELAIALQELLDGEAIVTRGIFDRTLTLRDLYLYYLTISSMPNE